MKRLILAAGALLLATANTPPSSVDSVVRGGELDSVVAAEAPKGNAPAATKPAKPNPPRIAAAPEPDPRTYPRCSATVQDRCVQGRSRGPHRAAVNHRRMQLAMRAGERG
ncbi:MAG TPA: hypothetical protein VK403_13235 [Allosphingosinicella sp.]|nr:hypothetical protein [Allosphingosinicella sp.]